MKKFLVCFFLFNLYAVGAMADNSAAISRVIPGQKNSEAAVVSRNTTNKTVVQNANVVDETVAADENLPTQDVENNLNQNRAATVNTVRTGNFTPSRTGVSRAVVAGADSTNSRDNLETAVKTVGRNARTQAAGINSTAAVRRAGISLRPSTAEVGGRAKIAGTDIQTGSNLGEARKARSVQTRAAKLDPEAIAAAADTLQKTSDLNKSCQQQYSDCMDQFCAVIDANQKRCTCSANLTKYAKVESAVKNANTELNNVAQRIRYVGLSADEIRAIMTATEAEDVLDGTKDNTESRDMLEQIEALIKDPTKVASTTSGSSTGLDMDLDFSSNSSDMFSVDFGGNSNSSSFANMRGTELYKTAQKRCSSVLTQCKNAGATEDQITGNYALAIDKDCLAYEQGLTKMNESLKTNVRSATQMLQKARLAVLQNQNEYDAKGCISALNTCMTDDMVCGSGYLKCLDPTKRYIDENGEVVLGQNISDITAFMENYNNAGVNQTFLSSAKSTTVDVNNCRENKDGSCVVKYLLEKIGTGDEVTDGGLCRAVLDKCQRYTYNDSDKYQPYNDIVVNYIQRAMVNVSAAQHKIISDYASKCMVDIATCYNKQVSQVSSWSSSASTDSVYNVMRGACRNVALTCSYAVFSGDSTSCPKEDTDANKNTCINNISEMFYQSLLCPDNSSYQSTSDSVASNGTVSGYVNDRCKCDNGYSVYAGACIKTCSAGYYLNSTTGLCVSCAAGTTTTIGALIPNECSACPSGSYCPGATGAKLCPSGTSAPLGSDALADCI